MSDSIIPHVDSHRDLGITLSEDLSNTCVALAHGEYGFACRACKTCLSDTAFLSTLLMTLLLVKGHNTSLDNILLPGQYIETSH